MAARVEIIERNKSGAWLVAIADGRFWIAVSPVARLKWLASLPGRGATPAGMIGAVALAESVDIQSGCVVHKNEKLARLIGTAERNIRRQLDDLASSGLILRLQQGRLAARFLIIEKLAAEQPSSSWPLDGHDRKAVISDKHDKLAIGRSQTWPPGGHNAGHSKFEVTDTSTTYAPHIMDDHGVDHGLSHRERALFCDDSIDRDSCSSPARAPEARAGDQGFDEVSIGLDPDRFEPELFI